jgi:hypothetical protein
MNHEIVSDFSHDCFFSFCPLVSVIAHLRTTKRTAKRGPMCGNVTRPFSAPVARKMRKSESQRGSRDFADMTAIEDRSNEDRMKIEPSEDVRKTRNARCARYA